MKLSSLFLVVLSLPSVAVTANSLTCLTSTTAGTDYFPDKVTPQFSQFWKVSYHNTYKIVTNVAGSATYVLYQCGTTPPAQDELGSGVVVNATLAIPLSKVSITTTPMISYMEQLGLLDRISYFFSDQSLITSPCFLKDVQDGSVLTGQEAVNTSLPALSTDSFNVTTNVNRVVFAAAYESFPTATVLAVGEYMEKTNAAIFEWIKFFSVFFNKEDLANQIFNKAQERFQCISSGAGAVVTDMPNKPKVLWAYYSNYCEGWSIAQCPNYYCEFATTCGVDLIQSSVNGTIAKCGSLFYTTEQLVEIGKGADYWFFPAPYWNVTYPQFKSQLDAMKAVQNKQVYDYQAVGENGWFESRSAEYYNVAQDYCRVVGTTVGVQGHGWFRNVFTQTVGAKGTCTPNSTGSILEDTFVCTPQSLTPPKSSPPSGGASMHQEGAMMLSWMALLASALFFM